MKKLILLVAALATCTHVHAAPSRSKAVELLYNQGFRDCAAVLDRAVKSAHENDASYSFLDYWSKPAPNTSIASTLTVEQFSEGRAVQSFSVVRNTSGSCDVIESMVLPILDQTCEALGSDSFKDWKRHEDLGAMDIYQDPRATSSTMSMTALGLNGCLLIKHAVWYEAEP